MTPISFRLAGLALLSLALASPIQAAAPIRSQRALDDYLRESAGTASPLDALSTGARKRFLDSLQFGSGGLGGFATDDLADGLTHAQAVAVLALFDADQYADIVDARDQVRAPRQTESEFEQRFDVFYRTVHASPDDLEQLARAYRQLLAGQNARDLAASLDTYDLELLYRATLPMVHGDADPSVFAYARHLLDTLAQRDDAPPARVRALFERLVIARDFEQADRLVDDFPRSGLRKLPPLRQSAGVPEYPRNSMLQVSADGRELSRAGLYLDKGVRMVVVAGCHFAQDAATAISADPRLERWFHEHATWLGPESESIDEVADWNRRFPRQPMRVAWRRSDWPMITSWNMPAFYLFRDGALVAQWSGWTPESGLQQVRKHLDAVGMRPVADEFLALAAADPEWLEESGYDWLATLPEPVRLQVADRAMAASDQALQFTGALQYYALHQDERADAAVAELILRGFDATGLAWGWIHSGEAGLAERRINGIRGVLRTRYDALPPEQQQRARQMLCDEDKDCDPHRPSAP